MPHAGCDAFTQAKRNGRKALAQDLKTKYRAEMEQEAKEALEKLRERWGKIYTPGCHPVGGQGLCAFGVPAPSQAHSRVLVHNKPAGAPGLGGETADGGNGGVPQDEAVEKLLYPALSNLNEWLGERRLRNFAETRMGSHHVAQTQGTRHYEPSYTLTMFSETRSLCTSKYSSMFRGGSSITTVHGWEEKSLRSATEGGKCTSKCPSLL